MRINEAGCEKVFGAATEIDGCSATGWVAQADFRDSRTLNANPAKLRWLKRVKEKRGLYKHDAVMVGGMFSE